MPLYFTTQGYKMLKKILLLAFSSALVYAHSLWVNSFESFTHKPGHTLVSLGWGHNMPLDDILNSPNGKMVVKEFNLISPDGKKTALKLPKIATAEPFLSNENVDLFDGEIGMQKIAFKKDTKSGTYAIEAISQPNFYTQYIDSKGKERMQLKPLDKIKDIKKVLMAVKFQAFGKTYLTMGNWEEQKPLGHGIEIVPLSDLSNVKVGDLVKFKVLFNGKELDASAKSIDYITAHSNSFGQSDYFSLFSYIIKGNAQFRVQSSGKWVVNVSHKEDIVKDGNLKELYGKAQQAYYSASLTFDVK